jgi:hypothetical protein
MLSTNNYEFDKSNYRSNSVSSRYYVIIYSLLRILRTIYQFRLTLPNWYREYNSQGVMMTSTFDLINRVSFPLSLNSHFINLLIPRT